MRTRKPFCPTCADLWKDVERETPKLRLNRYGVWTVEDLPGAGYREAKENLLAHRKVSGH